MWNLKAQTRLRYAQHRQNVTYTLGLTHHVTAAYITPQTLNNFNFHCFIAIFILHYFKLLLKSNNLNRNCICF